ncbi:hypothetical protein GCM10020221_15880 [Streptomyces thioluteus]|uniref:Uncharacterized protein n=1 Tax=Streptomyces thioluteus TaxID=66431 RepID=A0ABN3WLM3_STRTU
MGGVRGASGGRGAAPVPPFLRFFRGSAPGPGAALRAVGVGGGCAPGSALRAVGGAPPLHPGGGCAPCTPDRGCAPGPAVRLRRIVLGLSACLGAHFGPSGV